MPNKFGPHVQTWTDEVVAWCEVAHPSVVKVVATQERIPTLARWVQEGWLQDIILRSDPGDYLLDWDGDLEGQAAEEARRNLEFAAPFQAAGLGDRLWLEGRNEQPVWNDAEMIYYATHEAIRANLISAHRLKALCFQFPVGHPDFSLWDLIIPQLRMIKEYGGGLALHQYSQPTLTSAGPWTTWRHQVVYNAFPVDLQGLPLFITEFGIDGGTQYDEAPPPQPKQGWQAYCTEEWFTSQVLLVSGCLTKARGVTFFTFGNPDIWGTFEMENTLHLAAALAELNGPATAASPETTSGGAGEIGMTELSERKDPMPQFVFGFQALAEVLGADSVGEPQMDEASLPIGGGKVLTFQLTTSGMMCYVTGGSPVFLPALLPKA